MLEQNKFDGLFRQHCCSAVLRDCIYEFLILIARGDSRDEGLWIEWVAEDSEYEYLVDDREELRLVLDILPLDHLDNPTFMYRFGSGPSLHFPFDISTPAHILSGFRDGMRALPRYWHGGQYVDHAETHSARSGHSN
jgi:hypothetical protein